MNWKSYFVLLFTLEYLNAMVTTYSFHKKMIIEELKLTEDFLGNIFLYLGFVEMLSMLTRFISTVYLVVNPTKPRFAYTVSVGIQVFSYLLLIIPHFYH